MEKISSKLSDYRIISSRSREKVEEEIVKAIKAGFSPQGGITADDGYIMQAVIREEEIVVSQPDPIAVSDEPVTRCVACIIFGHNWNFTHESFENRNGVHLKVSTKTMASNCRRCGTKNPMFGKIP